MTTLEDKFSSLYGTEAHGGVATVFLPGIQGASVAGPQGDKGDKGDKGDRGPEGPQGVLGSAGAPGRNGATFFPSVEDVEEPWGCSAEHTARIAVFKHFGQGKG